jgi:hypothetical protein
MQAIDENKEIDIPEIVIHKNKKVTFDDEKKFDRTSAIPSRNGEFYRLRDISMNISFILSFSILCLVYYFINVELYKRHRNCRDDLINDEVMAMVVSQSEEGYVTYRFNGVDCEIPNRGQVSEIGKKYLIYKSNNNECSLEKNEDKCSGELIIYNFLFTIIGMPFVLLISYVFFQCIFKTGILMCCSR